MHVIPQLILFLLAPVCSDVVLLQMMLSACNSSEWFCLFAFLLLFVKSEPPLLPSGHGVYFCDYRCFSGCDLVSAILVVRISSAAAALSFVVDG